MGIPIWIRDGLEDYGWREPELARKICLRNRLVRSEPEDRTRGEREAARGAEPRARLPSALQFHLVAPETVHVDRERQSRDTVGPAIRVPGHLLPYRDAVGTQFVDGESEIGGWVGV